LYNKQINIISLSDNIDLSTATGRLQFQILAAFASFERDLIRERTIEGLNRARMQGKKLGRPKGRKDSRPRKKSGYYLRHVNGKQTPLQIKGVC
jgi:putative DNA-invertase from lambdoid prophage Rac